ncbi:heparan-alpha-glucosaminide N-acetyltransferase [Candidatus Soleaferrea massiliensis]|uniref:heparan-alpha-glucosaminide N-acetyltransferase n=1 Tax=Candidatus Soleaferrea massiliensis TaxID=1470354 RepID=UPI000693346E|nr:heparan-alpha-glucosaminide N-acetyltransferase [Candidatus Soleaferrea massiliensis]
MKQQQIRKDRVHLIDEVRGFAILCMVIYHAGYDLVSIFSVDIPFFFSPELSFIRDIFAGMFIFISGTACKFSSNNLKRGVQCFLLGMLMTFVTDLVMPSQFIAFGILHMLGVCMILYGLFSGILSKIRPLWGILGAAALFLLTMHLREGYLGLSFLPIQLPEFLYETRSLFPFGFTGPGFYSSDYFALFPWLFVFLAGSYFGVYVKEHRLPDFIYKSHCRLLAFAGRHTLVIYVLHQPVVYGILMLVFLVIGPR